MNFYWFIDSITIVVSSASNALIIENVDASEAISNSTVTNASELSSLSTITYVGITTTQSNDNGPPEARGNMPMKLKSLPTISSASRVSMTGSSRSHGPINRIRESQEATTGSSSSRMQTTGRGGSQLQMTGKGGSRVQVIGRGNTRVTRPGSHSLRVTATGPGVEHDYDFLQMVLHVFLRERSNEMQFTGCKTGSVLQSVPPACTSDLSE